MAAWKKWALGVLGSIVTLIITLAIMGQLGHYARAGETEATVAAHAEILTPLIQIAEELSARAKAEDASIARDAELCRAGKLRDCEDCARAGAELKACMK